jgi:hypothetical protein
MSPSSSPASPLAPPPPPSTPARRQVDHRLYISSLSAPITTFNPNSGAPPIGDTVTPSLPHCTAHHQDSPPSLPSASYRCSPTHNPSLALNPSSGRVACSPCRRAEFPIAYCPSSAGQEAHLVPTRDDHRSPIIPVVCTANLLNQANDSNDRIRNGPRTKIERVHSSNRIINLSNYHALQNRR